MAENLLSNNIEFSNQMFMPEADEDAEDNGGSIIRMREPNNFSNPVYEDMYGGQQRSESENEGLLRPNEVTTADLIETVEDDDDNAEAVDLLTERHRGNISL